MVAEEFIHSWGSLKTCELMEKIILSYQCISPWPSTEGNGVNNISNSAYFGIFQKILGCLGLFRNSFVCFSCFDIGSKH